MKRIILLIALLVFPLQEALFSALLAPPCFVEGEEDHPFEMGWESEGVRFGFHSNGGGITLALEISKGCWEKLSPKEKPLFRLTGNGSYLFGYSTVSFDPWKEASGILARRDAAIIGEPLKGDGSRPYRIDEEEVREWVRGKKVLFYTGAGLSIASGIPDMRRLEEQLGFTSSNTFEAALRWALTPEAIGEGVVAFRDACFNSDPSKGHHALTHLSIVTNQQILTENLDRMHERVGTRPLRISKEVLSEEDSVGDIDAVICVGLSRDDKGFLRWLKDNHRAVKLIAVNPACPHYLSGEDLWCKGDAHEVLEQLATETKANRLAIYALNR